MTEDERLRIDDAHVVKGTEKLLKGSACAPHLHGYTVKGKKIVDPNTGDAHFPLKPDHK